MLTYHRTYTFKKDRPLTLGATIQPPVAEDDPTEHINLAPFVNLIKLFRPFDDTFFDLWYKKKSGVMPAWLVQLQTHLSTALPSYVEGTESQLVDLRVTQLWLKTMVWQLSITHGYISTMAQDPALGFRFPIDVSRELVHISNDYPGSAMKAHGLGLVSYFHEPSVYEPALTLVFRSRNYSTSHAPCLTLSLTRQSHRTPMRPNLKNT